VVREAAAAAVLHQNQAEHIQVMVAVTVVEEVLAPTVVPAAAVVAPVVTPVTVELELAIATLTVLVIVVPGVVVVQEHDFILAVHLAAQEAVVV
jgi:hypothetical protein